jgi:peptide/nickel transport system permease protein
MKPEAPAGCGVNSMKKNIAAKEPKKTSPGTEIIERLFQNKSAITGLFVIVVLIIAAFLSKWIIPYPYDRIDFAVAYASPSLRHFMGCDELGRDIFSRLLFGARYSLRIGLFSVLISSCIGIIFGSLAGYFGGLIDNLLMRFLDIFQAIPGMLMSIIISAVLGPGFVQCIIAIALSSMPGYARILRGSILTIRKMEYLEAASSINSSHARIILKHVLPNAFSPLIVQATLGSAGSIILAAGLSYVGLGVQPPIPEWGAMLSAGRNFIRDYPHLVIFPGLMIMITVLSLNMLGDGLRDAMDPKLRK